MSTIDFPWHEEQFQEYEESLDVSSREQNEVVVEDEDFLRVFRSRVGGGKGGVLVRRWTPTTVMKGSMIDCVHEEQWQKVE